MFGSWIFTKRNIRRVNDEKSELVQYVKLQDEIYSQKEKLLQGEYSKLYAAYQQLLQETAERDYEEFKAPDKNGDDVITKAEVCCIIVLSIVI
jgi:hypothetical protein